MGLQKHEEQIIKATYSLVCCYRNEVEQKKNELLELINVLATQRNMAELAKFMLVSFAWEEYNQRLFNYPSDWSEKSRYLLYFAKLTSSSISFANVDAAILNLKTTILPESVPQEDKPQSKDAELDLNEWNEIDASEAIKTSRQKSWVQRLFSSNDSSVPEDEIIVNSWHDHLASKEIFNELQR